jgi:hypothetical protein
MKNYLLLFSILFILTNCSTPKPEKVEKEEIRIGVVGPVPGELPSISKCVPSDDWIVPFGFEDKIDKVRLAFYHKLPFDFLEKNNIGSSRGLHSLFIKGEDFDFDIFTEVVDLNEDQKLQLFCVLQSYNQSEFELYGAECYVPHHCIFFLDKEDRILSYVELCFQCSRTEDDIEDFEIVCNDQLDELQAVFSNAGLRIR